MFNFKISQVFSFCFVFVISSFQVSSAEVLDKIAAIFNDRTISLSQVQRVQDNLTARRNISPQIYQNESYTLEELIDIMIERLLIRERLSDIGYVITDDQVESQIRGTEERLGLRRADLLEFLESNQTTFDEYFEIIRETIEFNVFNSRIIEPLINITEQEIKNTYYQQNVDNRTIAFNYHLVNFSMPKEQMTASMQDEFVEVLIELQERGRLPERFRNVRTADLGQVTEDGISDVILDSIRNVNEGEFSDPILIGNDYHVFFIKGRDVVESSHYRRARESIYHQLYQNAFNRTAELWYQRQANRHFIKINI